ncbi:MAG: hypothetical protein ACXWL5_04905, partial [Candidatus Chromulinivorax sp.]
MFWYKYHWMRFFLICIAVHSIPLQAQKNNLRCYQTDDFVRENKKYMQFVFVDEQDHCTGGYSEAYDDPGDGELFCYQNAIRIDQNKLERNHQKFLQTHQQSVTRMQMHAMQLNSIAQKQYIGSLFLQGLISTEQAWMQEWMLDQKQLINEAQKQAKQVRKQNEKANKEKLRSEKKLNKLVDQSGEKSTIASTTITQLQQKN